MPKLATICVQLTLVFAAALAGCISLGGHTPPDSVCQPRQCLLDVQNDDGPTIAVRYYDSTGVGDVLGSVRSGSVQRFALTRRTGRTIIIEVSDDGKSYRTQTKVSPAPFPNVIHFPADFDRMASR
jgi:hypothetical protein